MNSFGALSLPSLLLAGLTAASASAGISARLVYLRAGSAESCPDQAALRKAVARRLGYDPFLAAALHTIVAEVSGTGGELRARARIVDDSGIVRGSRELVGNGTDCAELLDSLALAISLTLDPMAPAVAPGSAAPDVPQAPQMVANELPKPEPIAPTAVPESKSTQPSARRTTPAQPLPDHRATSLSLRAGALGAAGWVPGLSAAAELGLSLRYQRWSVGFDAVAVAPRSEASPQGSSAKVSVAYAALSPCYWFTSVGVCPLVALGRYAAQGAGVEAPRAGNHLYAAAGMRGQATLPLGARWSAGLQVDGVRNLTQPEFLVAGHPVYRPPAWAANAGIFAAWQLF